MKWKASNFCNLIQIIGFHVGLVWNPESAKKKKNREKYRKKKGREIKNRFKLNKLILY